MRLINEFIKTSVPTLILFAVNKIFLKLARMYFKVLIYEQVFGKNLNEIFCKIIYEYPKIISHTILVTVANTKWNPSITISGLRNHKIINIFTFSPTL